jgi:hypothetical protein
MLTRKTPTALATELTINGQGTTEKFNVTYKVRTQDAINEVLTNAAMQPEAQNDDGYANRKAVLFIVESIEAEYPLTDEGIKEMETDRPGMIEVLFLGYHKARRVELVKN